MLAMRFDESQKFVEYAPGVLQWEAPGPIGSPEELVEYVLGEVPLYRDNRHLSEWAGTISCDTLTRNNGDSPPPFDPDRNWHGDDWGKGEEAATFIYCAEAEGDRVAP